MARHAALALALCGGARAFYLPGVAPRTFRYGDKVERAAASDADTTGRVSAAPRFAPRRTKQRGWGHPSTRVEGAPSTRVVVAGARAETSARRPRFALTRYSRRLKVNKLTSVHTQIRRRPA